VPLGDVSILASLPSNTTVIVAGFPCQDLSPSGGKVGIDGPRSGLVSHVFRLAASTPSVEWLVLENVHFMLKLDGGRAMGLIVSLLEALVEVGLPHAGCDLRAPTAAAPCGGRRLAPA
jgi:DNA (cytosine-5)-methyltransferase 1